MVVALNCIFLMLACCIGESLIIVNMVSTVMVILKSEMLF
jgi:hypothetical protein